MIGGTVVNDLPTPNRVLLAVVLSLLLLVPQGMVQRLHAQSATPSSARSIPRPAAGWTIPAAAPLPAVRQVSNLNIRVIQGDDALNNISTQTAQNPIVEIRDQNGNPVEGASVTFFLPENGPSATFTGGGTILGTVTDGNGRAAATGLTPNDVQGQFDIQVQATYEERTVTTSISQTNTLTGTPEGGRSSTAIVILSIVGAAAAGVGLALARRSDGGGGGSTPPPDPITITPGTPTVGAPQ